MRVAAGEGVVGEAGESGGKSALQAAYTCALRTSLLLSPLASNLYTLIASPCTLRNPASSSPRPRPYVLPRHSDACAP